MGDDDCLLQMLSRAQNAREGQLARRVRAKPLLQSRAPIAEEFHRQNSLSGDALKMSENEAPANVADREEEERLRALVAEYEARLKEFAQLAARARHEINNPLTGLIGQAQLLLREELSDTARRRVQTIEQLANRIRDTVASLREIQLPRPDPRDGETTDEPPRH
jgi:signal transduction histidine kinase